MHSLMQISKGAQNPDQIHSTDSSLTEMHSAIRARDLCFLMVDALYRILLRKHRDGGSGNWVPIGVGNDYVPVRSHNICCGKEQPHKHQC